MSERQTVFCDGPRRGFDNTFEEGDFCSEKCVQEWLVKDALPTARSGAR